MKQSKRYTPDPDDLIFDSGYIITPIKRPDDTIKREEESDNEISQQEGG